MIDVIRSWGTKIPFSRLYKVKLGQKGQTGSKRPNFHNQKFLPKTYLSCPGLSQDSKNVSYFYLGQLEMPKIVFQKSDIITFTCFFFLTIAQPNIKILLWNLVCVLFVCWFIANSSVFWMTPKCWFLLAFIFGKPKFWVSGVKIEKY